MSKKQDGRRNNTPPTVGRRGGGGTSRVYQFRLNSAYKDESALMDVIPAQDHRAFFKALVARYMADKLPSLEPDNHELKALRATVEWIADQIQNGALVQQTKSTAKKQKAVAMPSAIADTLNRYMNMGSGSNGDDE